MAEKKKRTSFQKSFIKGFTGKDIGLEKRKKPLTVKEAEERRKRIKGG